MRGENTGGMARRSLAAALTLMAAVMMIGAFGLAPTPAAAKPRGGFIVFEPETGRVLNALRSRVKLHPASLTKMMTLYLTFEALEKGELRLDQKLRVSKHAAKMPAMEVGLRRGDRITVRDAIRSAAVHSANDSAVVLAEAIGGSEPAFARKMTAKAHALGMKDTRFRNATGFTRKDHLTTARDMAILARRLWLDFPQYYGIFSKTAVRVKGHRLGATNGLLGEPGVDGIKTGYTRAAGYNLAASAERDGKRVSVVLMGGRTKNRRNHAVAELLDDGFERLKKLPPAETPPRPRLRPAEGVLTATATETAKTPAPVPTPRPEHEPTQTTKVAARSGKRSLGQGAPQWAVQLGAFFHRYQARDFMAKLVENKSPGLAGGFRSIVTGQAAAGGGKTRTIHRVRFTGLDEKEARAACRALLKKKTACALVPPQGWGG